VRSPSRTSRTPPPHLAAAALFLALDGPPAGGLCYVLPGYTEMLVVLVVGLLIFGRDLPQVGQKLGRAINDLRRQFNTLKREISDDASLREARSSVRDLGREVQRPLSALDPKRVFDDVMNGTSAAEEPPPAPPIPEDATVLPPPPEQSLFEQELRRVQAAEPEGAAPAPPPEPPPPDVRP
jgi:sec-independent protein translocase protein TatA